MAMMGVVIVCKSSRIPLQIVGNKEDFESQRIEHQSLHSALNEELEQNKCEYSNELSKAAEKDRSQQAVIDRLTQEITSLKEQVQERDDKILQYEERLNSHEQELKRYQEMVQNCEKCTGHLQYDDYLHACKPEGDL